MTLGDQSSLANDAVLVIKTRQVPHLILHLCVRMILIKLHLEIRAFDAQS
jgi:hypothetical protein